MMLKKSRQKADKARFFPVLLVAALFLLMFKFVNVITGDHAALSSLFQASAQEKKPAPKKSVSTPDLTAAKKTPGNDPAQINTINTTEVKILERLAERRNALDKKARVLELKENLINAAEQKIDNKIKQLQHLYKKVAKIKNERERKKTEGLNRLVKMYSTMKPKHAARIFNRLDIKIMIDVAQRMNTRKMAPILALMNDAAAERLTLEMISQARGHQPARVKPAQLPAISPGPRS